MEELGDKLTKILVYEESEEGGFVCKLQMAMLQADSVLTYCCICNKADVICLKDTDFVVFACQQCLMIRDFCFKQGRGQKKWSDSGVEVKI
eukprot:14516312-Ditylum_brightwellii.AAC.1